MEIGLSTATFFGKVPVEDSFALFRKFHVTTGEVFLTTYSEYLPEFGALLKKRSAGIAVHSVHTLNSQFEPQLYHSVERTRKDAEAVFRMALANAQQLNAKYYTFHGPARLKRKEYVFDYPALGKRTQELYALCAEFGVTLSYENVHWAYYYRPEYFTELLRFCPCLVGTLDIKQAFQSGIPYREFVAAMGERITTVHVCDYAADGKLTPIGKGCFDFKELFRVLKGEGVDAPVLVELYSGDYRNLDEVGESIDYLRALA